MIIPSLAAQNCLEGHMRPVSKLESPAVLSNNKQNVQNVLAKSVKCLTLNICLKIRIRFLRYLIPVVV